ncbi:MAG: hypothetical protein M1829_000256 [Trizodia sp. TS-e1964]|nr:MAG: hypothetical protein M1829_000256 [Trizodia sp. TS-e1964]
MSAPDSDLITITENAESKIPIPRRPNYNQIHCLPLPIKTYPLPTFLPHNPLSIIHIFYSFITHALFPPPSHPVSRFLGYFSPNTRSVHITDPQHIRALWEQGFFGKGSLSRSEPSWLDREKRRKGLTAKLTSEEVTTLRREERKKFKSDRARKERELIEQKLQEEGKFPSTAAPAETDVPSADITNFSTSAKHAVVDSQTNHDGIISSPSVNHSAVHSPNSGTKSARFPPTIEIQKTPELAPIIAPDLKFPSEESNRDETIIYNQEHLQLTLEEAFFLVYGLGVLDILDYQKSTIPSPLLLDLFRGNSNFPSISSSKLEPDDPFLLSYVVYHHFRSLGWVVRPGVKFAVDYLLYHRGPVFSHAEFAVVILPSYDHPFYSDSSSRQSPASKGHQSKGWWWLHCANRVQSQVRKNLILAYVEIPPPSSCALGQEGKMAAVPDIGAILASYRIKDIAVKRWIPNRDRD